MGMMRRICVAAAFGPNSTLARSCPERPVAPIVPLAPGDIPE